MTKKPQLPLPPEFPASNASYNKIVDKMHKAALNAATSEAAIAAVSMCKSAVKGINTYSKKCRRYGDELLVALGVPAEAAPAVAQGVADAVEAKAAAVEALGKGFTPKEAAAIGKVKAAVEAKAKPAMPQLAKSSADQFGTAPNGQPTIVLGTGRTFSNKSNAKRALKKEALDHLPVAFEKTGNGDEVRPVVSVDGDKGAAYAAERGFAFKVLA